MLRFIVWSSLALTAARLSAAPLKFDSLRVGSKTYSNVTIIGANSTDLYFTFDHGIVNVKLRYLDPILQQRFKYDPKVAVVAERQQDAEDSLYVKTLASNIAARAQQTTQAAKKAAQSSEDNIADPISPQSLLGKTAPPLQVEKWLSEKPATEAKVVLVAFWAPWSIPCRRLIPELNALQRRFPEKLVVVGLTSDSQAEVEAMTDARIEFSSAIDSKARLSGAVGVNSIPYVLLLDSKNIVRYQGHPAAITPEKLQALLAKIQE